MEEKETANKREARKGRSMDELEGQPPQWMGGRPRAVACQSAWRSAPAEGGGPFQPCCGKLRGPPRGYPQPLTHLTGGESPRSARHLLPLPLRFFSVEERRRGTQCYFKDSFPNLRLCPNQLP